MDFAFSKEQKMYGDAAREFLRKECPMESVREILKEEKGYSPDLWKKIADLFWLGILVDEKYGGLGGSLIDLCPIMEEIGWSLFPSPFFPTVIMAAPILSEETTDETKKKLLPSIVNGDLIISVGVGETGREWADDTIKTKAEKSGEGYIVRGTKLFVPFAGASDFIICCAKDSTVNDNGTSLFLIDGKNEMVECIPIPSFSVDKYYLVRFNGVEVPEENLIGKPGNGWGLIQKHWPRMVASRCVEMVGSLRRVLEMTVQYVKKREQFGAPIGSFQVIQHYCADMAIDVETSKFIAYEAVWKVSNNLPRKAEVSIAKAWCGDAFQRVTALALQAHGAMGFTEEYDLHLFYKQAKALQLMYGGSAYHRQMVAKEMGF